jgi:hypothetical protein
MNDGDLLLRIAETLKEAIAPAVAAEYPKTQAFMAAVVLQKLGRQIALAPEHARAARADLDALIGDLPATVPDAVRRAVEQLAQSRDAAALCRLIESLYASREALGERRFEDLLARVRRTLRADIERRMEYAE